MKFSATILLGFVALSNAFAQHAELQSSLQVSGVGAQSFNIGALERIPRAISHKSTKCNDSCIHGATMDYNECWCKVGYIKHPHDPCICEPYCTYSCKNSRCTSPNYCTCNEGYRRSVYYLNVCNPVCSDGCQHGHCVGPNKCKCYKYAVADKDAKNNSICVPACNKLCIHGTCDRDSYRCYCDYGWTGTHCQQPTVCSISLASNSLVNLNRSAHYEKSTGKETWLRPICDSGCISKITNDTKCIDKPAQNVTCFVNFNDACNADAAAKYYGRRTHKKIIIAWTALAVFIIIIAAIVEIKKRSDSLDSERSILVCNR